MVKFQILFKKANLQFVRDNEKRKTASLFGLFRCGSVTLLSDKYWNANSLFTCFPIEFTILGKKYQIEGLGR